MPASAVVQRIHHWLGRPPAALDPPLRDELLSIELLEDRARALAGRFTVDPRPGRATRRSRPRLDANARLLGTAYRTLAKDVRRGEFVTPAGEWLLDNYHLVAAEIRDVRHNLPRDYYLELPKLAAREMAGAARIYALAVELVRHSDSRLDRPKLVRFVNSFQTVAPLTIGELWAWPSMLRLALIENLRLLAAETLDARSARLEADAYVALLDAAGPDELPDLPATLHSAFVVQLLQRSREYGVRLAAVRAAVDEHLATCATTSEDAIRSEHQAQAAAQVSVANVITSLRLCSTLDWSHYFEAVSLVERVLQQDPPGVYGRMDFRSRDRYRQAVEQLAAPTGTSQQRVALRAVESARVAAEAGTVEDRAAHVGYHLIGKGRPDLEADVAYRPPLRRRPRRFVFAHPTSFYLGSIAILTALLCAAGMAYAAAHGASLVVGVAVALVLLLPASDVAITVVQRLVAWLAVPSRLPRLELAGGVPERARTLVVVPTFLPSVQVVEELLEQLEVNAFANLDPHVHFAILGDFTDAQEPSAADDEQILAAARAGIEALNARSPDGRRDRYFLFHRERQWNPKEGLWMGWERKRGKLEELNRLLRGATDTSLRLEIGDPELLPRIRYCITLDSDTLLPRDTAKSLIGIIEHPLNRPTLDSRVGRVTEGYGILQPRVSVTMASAAGSLFARLYAGHTGVDPYTTAVSDTYQDFFAEGIFTGKGLYDVDAFLAALENRVPENRLLSHDLFEGLYARTGLVTDIELVDDFPSTVLAHARRQHRWVRGDWQILQWLFPFVPTRRGGLEPNRLPLISRWKILDNLRRSLMPPATVVLLLLAWTVLPGDPVAWTAAVLIALGFPAILLLVDGMSGPRPQQPWAIFVRHFAGELETALARACLQLVLLASQAAQMVNAVVVTLVRLATRRRLLVWETAAASTQRGGRPGAAAMIATTATALGGAVLVALTRPTALPVALPVLALWLASPGIAWLLSQPARTRTAELGERDRLELGRIARKTWQYFEELAGAEHHGLPPDNLQEIPDRRIAYRTSPTNIGMGLLATLAAHDLDFVGTEELVERTDAR